MQIQSNTDDNIEGRGAIALLLTDGKLRHHELPIPLKEEGFIRPGFHIRPLLPALARDGSFVVLTMTADVFRLFDPSEFEEEKKQATERVQARLGSGDGRVAMSAQDIAEAAQAGRIDTLLLSKTADNSKAGGGAEDPLDAALFETLRNGGEVRIFAADEMQGDVGAAALLRY